MCYRAVNTFSRSEDHELLGPGPYSKGPLTIWYRAVDRELTGPELYFT